MQKCRRDAKTGPIKSTEFGDINRMIEQSVSEVFKGERGAIGKAIGFAKKRERYLLSKPKTKKSCLVGRNQQCKPISSCRIGLRNIPKMSLQGRLWLGAVCPVGHAMGRHII